MCEILMNEPNRWLDLGHSRLPYWRIGQGPDLVFVHGWPLDARTWRKSVDELQQHYTCHLFDLPGAGRSQCTEKTPLGIQEFGEITSQAMDLMDFNKSKVGLVGHDSGGAFARMAAAQNPERIAGMLLANTEISGHHPWRFDALLGAMKIGALKPFWPMILGSSLGRRILLFDAFHDLSLIEKDFAHLFFEPLAHDAQALKTTMSLAEVCLPTDFDGLEALHAQISAPVRLFWGEDDPWFPLKKAKGMMAEFAGPVEIQVIEDAKLLVHEEHPEAFTKSCLEHFAKCFEPRKSAVA